MKVQFKPKFRIWNNTKTHYLRIDRVLLIIAVVATITVLLSSCRGTACAYVKRSYVGYK